MTASDHILNIGYIRRAISVSLNRWGSAHQSRNDREDEGDSREPEDIAGKRPAAG
jgi:hypothetical protein